MRAVPYVSLNPVRARPVARAEDWCWSGVSAHLAGQDHALVSVRPILSRVTNFKERLQPGLQQDFRDLRDAEGTGRPLGPPEFVAGLEALPGRKIAEKPETDGTLLASRRVGMIFMRRFPLPICCLRCSMLLEDYHRQCWATGRR